jgi:ATP-dependent DNA helicase PIF1
VDPSWVSITPVTARWETRAGKSLTRTQLPLTLAWAITIHKSQGLTLEKVVVDLGHADFSSGLSFVAISRVKSLKGLAFRTQFDQARLQRPKETAVMRMLQEDNIRRSQLDWELNDYGMDLSEYLDNFYE